MTAQIKMTRKEAEVQMACFRQTFSSVRLLNEKAVLHAPQAHSKRTELECRVLHEKRQLTTLDVTPQRAEQIFARYVMVGRNLYTVQSVFGCMRYFHLSVST